MNKAGLGFVIVFILAACACSPAFGQGFPRHLGETTDTTTEAASGFTGFKTPKLYKQNVLKANLIPFIVGQIPYCGEIRLTYERMLAPQHSLTIGGSYNYPNLILMATGAMGNTGFNKLSVKGGRIIAGYRFYPIKKTQAPKGLFFGPFFSYNYAKIQERKNSNGDFDELHYINADLIVGYQIKMGKTLFLEFFGGPGYRKNTKREYDAYTKTSTVSDAEQVLPIPTFLRHVKFVIEMNLGFSF